MRTGKINFTWIFTPFFLRGGSQEQQSNDWKYLTVNYNLW